MNKDFLITDTLTLKSYDDLKSSGIGEILSGWHENLKSKIEIQPLIINEFQPYDMLSPADLMPGVINSLIKGTEKFSLGLAGIAVSVGRNSLMKDQIDSISNDPSILYNKSGEKDIITRYKRQTLFFI